MRLTEIRQLLERLGFRPRRHLGQNFLHDANVVRKILAEAELGPQDMVLEIGPGLGALTVGLCSAAGCVLAIERDRGLVSLLEAQFGKKALSWDELRSLLRAPDMPMLKPGAGLVLVHGDALDLVQERGFDLRQWKVVSNLPYSVASPILVELARGSASPEHLVVTVQLEVARRLTAAPGSGEYGLLTVLVGVDFEPELRFRISPRCFYPEPEVVSACVALRRRSCALVPDLQRDLFQRIVKRAFSQRRKMMFKLLRQEWPEAELLRAFAAAGLAPDVRAEDVSIPQFAAVTQELAEFGQLPVQPGAETCRKCAGNE